MLATLLFCRPAPAVPHTISHSHHPFDPDWPEICIILANKCTGCHRPNSDYTDYTSYESLMAAEVDGMKVVEPGNLDDSMLWQYVVWNTGCEATSDQPDEPMMPPEKHEWLTSGQLALIRRWIETGANQYRHPADPHGGLRRPLLESDFPSAKQCGYCHPKQYNEWSRSMHAYAQHSPIFEAFNLALIERTGGTIDTFCSRCHTPLGTALGENGSRRNVHRSRLSMEGITCVTCHRRPQGQYKANSRIVVTPGKLMETCVFGPFENPVSLDHNAHPSVQQPYIRSSQFCGECHDVTSPEGIRLEEAFSEWQNSPAAKDGVTCQHCHMGPIQGVPVAPNRRPLGPAAQVPGVPIEQMPLRHLTDHTFAGPDYSLLPDTEFPHKLDWMYETDYRRPECLTEYQQATLNELRVKNRRHLRIADNRRYELLSNAAKLHVQHPPTARAGSKIKIRADVTSTFSGHSFPTGFTAERQLWVFVEVRDASGQLVFASGDLDANNDLRDNHSHAVLSNKVPADFHLFNFQSKFVALTNKGTERSVVLSVNRHLSPLNVLRPAAFVSASFGRPPGFRIAKGSLPPLATMGKSYPVKLPPVPGQYTVRVQLNFRHLPPALLDHIGTPHLKHLLEIVVIDDYEDTIHVY